MSFGRNVVANFVSQAYVAVVSLAVLPIYLDRLGAEGYGLVGFYVALQGWFQILDLGLTLALSREAARMGAGAIHSVQLRRLVRLFECVFIFIGVIGASAIVIEADWISSHWLNSSYLSPQEIQTSIVLIGLTLPLRWTAGLYKGLIAGLEHQVWLSGFNIVIASLRYIAVISWLSITGDHIGDFFRFQLAVAAIELFVAALMAYRFLPQDRSLSDFASMRTYLREVIVFSLSIGIAGLSWAALTQADKLVLSATLSLREFGFFSLATTAAGGVLLINGPLSQALLPRMTSIFARHGEVTLNQFYRQATQLSVVLTAPACLTIVLLAKPILWAWTGNATVADNAATVLLLYALGNGVLSAAAFPYYLQYARGAMRLHVIGNLAMLAFLFPALIWATQRYGAVGAGYVWLSLMTVYFIGWTWVVHSRFLPDMHWRWLTNDVLAIFGAVAIIVGGSIWILPEPNGRLASAALALFVWALGTLAAVFTSPLTRDYFLGSRLSRLPK